MAALPPPIGIQQSRNRSKPFCVYVNYEDRAGPLPRRDHSLQNCHHLLFSGISFSGANSSLRPRNPVARTGKAFTGGGVGALCGRKTAMTDAFLTASGTTVTRPLGLSLAHSRAAPQRPPSPATQPTG